MPMSEILIQNVLLTLEDTILSPTEKGGGLGKLCLKSTQVQIQVLRSELAREEYLDLDLSGLEEKLPEEQLHQVLRSRAREARKTWCKCSEGSFVKESGKESFLLVGLNVSTPNILINYLSPNIQIKNIFQKKYFTTLWTWNLFADLR